MRSLFQQSGQGRLSKARLRIGTRPSRLARAQVEEFLALWREVVGDTAFDILVLSTPGDHDKETPLTVAPDDFFTRTLDEALLDGRIDLAVHSAKDLPQAMPAGLTVAAYTPPLDVRECLISRGGESLSQLQPGAVVGTSSQRRRDHLLILRPDLVARPIRGNIEERLAQLAAGEYQALLMAYCALLRLGLSRLASEVFAPQYFPPSPGQGQLAVVVRSDDYELREALLPLNAGLQQAPIAPGAGHIAVAGADS